MKSIIESVRDYFLNCPYLLDNVRLNVDFLSENPIEYGLYTEVGDTLIKKYVDGDKLKQFNFIFVTTTHMSGDLIEQLENSSFFDKLKNWIEEENRKKNYPILEGNKYPLGIEVITDGYLSNANADSAQYQIQMKLKYMEVI
ncbi:hypothetical protein [uncultured Anaerococcus sp.]|uniref:hypothetical protein n=1 Tax=uncultured Anaerococcus sp. TaxID=293428 RepID=UPI00262DE76F|nr:hypothetical protein [uncultured Anaerococcus sp.]